MKSKKTFIIIAILIAVLILGIGYAAISNTTLNISGTASVTPSDENFKVKFDNTAEIVTTGPQGATIAGEITDDTNASISVSGLTTINQVATVTYTIVNNSTDIDATLSAVTTSGNTGYFEVSYEFDENTIGPGETAEITVKVKALKNAVENNVQDNIGVTITAAASTSI